MKPSTLLVVSFCTLVSFSLPASARSLPLAKGGVLPIPDQAVVSPEGVTFVRPGEPAPTTVPWQSLDLAKLARMDPALELGRQKALLTGEKILLAAEAPKANPYAEFLNLPVKVTFRTKETHQTKVETSSVTTAVPPVAPLVTNPEVTPGTPSASALAAQPQRFVNNSATTRSDTTINQTRQPLDTTVAGFLELISDVTQSSSGNLLREVREQPHVFTNILTELRSLQAQFPADSVLTATAEAIQKLAKNGPVSIDAQNALRRLVATLRTRAEER
jgi:hypothetical protein